MTSLQSDKDQATNLDTAIINYLCDEVFPTFSIDRKTLNDWQIELIDCFQDYGSLSNSVEKLILSIDEYDKGINLDVESFTTLINKLNELDEETYHDFQIIVLELLLCVFSMIYNLKIRLHKLGFHQLLIESFLHHLSTKTNPDEEHMISINRPSITNQYSRLIITFLELGCDIPLFKSLISPLYTNSSPILKLVLLDLLEKIYTNYPAHFQFILFNKITSFPFVNDEIKRNFTIHSWFKINHQNTTCDEPVTLFTLTNSNGGSEVPSSTSLSVQLINYNQFMVEIKNHQNGTTEQLTFNHILKNNDNSDSDDTANIAYANNQGYIQFALTYDNYANISLFIDGEYSESIPCPDIHRVISSWNKLYIGSEASEVTDSSDELFIKNLSILNTSLSYEWINLLFNLGLSYEWDFKEFNTDNLLNLLNHLSYRGLVNVGIKQSELRNQRKESNRPQHTNLFGSQSGSKSNNHNGRNYDYQNRDSNNSNNFRSNLSSYIKNNLQTDKLGIFDRNLIVKSLSKLRQENILFDTSDLFQTFEQQQKFQKLSVPTSASLSSFIYHNSPSVHGALYTIGGASLLLKVVETSIEVSDAKLRDTLLYKALNVLFIILNNNWRLSKEFENINGYGILSILLTNYAEKYNKSLTFTLYEEFLDNKLDTLTGCSGVNLLNMVLSHAGYDFISPYESLIINPLGYRFLVLNFDLFYGSDSFEYLLYHIQILIQGSKYSEFNKLELHKMKLLKKVIQFLKSSSMVSSVASKQLKEQLSLTLRSIIISDPSVDTIKSLALYINYALYNTDASTEYGILVLQTLTDFLCDSNSSIKTLRKFSRSITIHWILLLFQFQSSKEVAICGFRLLSKLLKILGPGIIGKFFQVNHGLDILTHFLKHWWEDDEVLSCIFLSSVGIEENTSTLKSKDAVNRDLSSILSSNLPLINQIAVPEFLLLLNNLVLNSMYVYSLRSGQLLGSNPASPTKNKVEENLTLSLNVLHLINSYIDAVSLGFEKVTALKKFFMTKYYLEGVTELLGYLQLSLRWTNNETTRASFKSTYEKLVSVITSFFISNLSESNVTEILDKLSDLTRKMTLDIIFPGIFEHVNQFVDNSKFIFNEKQFIDSVIVLLHYYQVQFLQQHHFVKQDDLDKYITCMLSIIEVAKDHHKGVGNLKVQLGDVILLKVLKLGDVEDPANSNGISNLNETLKLFLYRQVTLFDNEVLDEKKISQLIILVLGMFLKSDADAQSSIIEIAFSFLRACFLINQERISKIVSLIDADQKLLNEFFTNLVSKNDTETSSRLQKYAPFTRSINQNYNTLRVKYKHIEFVNVSEIIKLMLNTGGKLGQMNSIYIKSFEKDCDQLKASIINGELVKYNRSVQDHSENVQFFISSYQLLKVEISRLIEDHWQGKDYLLDYIENNDRMRRRMILSDQVPDSDKLSYNINVPLKALDTIKPDHFVDLQNYDYAIAASGIDTLSLSSGSAILMDQPDDSFEIIEEGSENGIDESDAQIAYEDKNRKVIRSLYMGDEIVALWNVSQVNGLVPIESLMILGSNHLYLIENYFHSQDGNVIDVQDAPPQLRDPILQLVNSQSSAILKSDSKSHRNKNWSLSTLSCISKRQFLLRDIAVEMFFTDGASILITCLSNRERDIIYNKLHSFASNKGLDSDLTQALQASSSNSSNSLLNSSTSFLSSRFVSAFSQNGLSPQSTAFLAATRKWRMGEMSNFYYLMIINTLAGRTFNDLTQYPVFPWVIADYTSDVLDLSNQKTFRDLSKPMGGQTEARAKEFEERFEALDSFNDNENPAFHYGTHYSSAMIVTSFLIRLKPYVQSYLLLQGGKFDHADRLFNSIEKAWMSASRDNTTDVRELTPEFFFLPEFLVNSNNFEFGTLQNGGSPNHVTLPPWAKGDPKIFIAKNREALESSYVSANLHLWIDLVFGYKQSGPEAVKALNVFHHLSYNGAINLDNINDEVEKRAVIGMINNFGQTPKRIFQRPHPTKEVLNLPNYYLNLVENEEHPRLLFESKLKLPIEKLELSPKNVKKWVGRASCITSEDDLLIRKANNLKFNSGSLIINDTTFLNIHRCNITSILQIGHKLFLTGSEDGIINVWKCEVKPTTSLQFQTILRGHTSSIISLKFSKSYKMGISLDNDGVVIVWDLARFKFVRKIISTVKDAIKTIISISNDTGNIAILNITETENILNIYTINGDLILTEKFQLNGKQITAFNFGSINDPMVDTGKHSISNKHTHWSNEIFAIAVSKSIHIYELTPYADEGWGLINLDSLELEKQLAGDITAIELFKFSETDSEDRLSRGQLKLILGDSTGKVYGL
ncbi:hypothetical protein DFJ63DRAFT_143436 [Scheffersomyces coipomensis]|uniref:uncharacterized protein n=1 Tax=Scheffersomyces coipomensis TaxID=1788519 RepID=UPI00315CECC8